MLLAPPPVERSRLQPLVAFEAHAKIEGESQTRLQAELLFCRQAHGRRERDGEGKQR